MTLKDILTIGFDPEDQTNLQQVRLTQSMTPIIIFMREVAQVFLHYLEDLEIRSYIHCNGNGCVLCSIKKALTEKFLLPVYVLTERRIGVLPVGPSQRPNSLLPQLKVVVTDSYDTVVTMIIRNGIDDFGVETKPLPPDVDAGENLIKDFMVQLKAGKIELKDVYRHIPNKELKQIPSIANSLKILGLEESAETSSDQSRESKSRQ